MIELTSLSNGRVVTHFIAVNGIALISEASQSAKWHGIHTFIRTFDGQTLEVCETVRQVKDAIDKAEVLT